MLNAHLLGLMIGAVAVTIVGSAARAVTRYVPQDYSTIQAAIDASDHLDVIVVSPGSYSGPVSFNGKWITLTSVDPTDPSVVASTILTGTWPPGGVVFAGSESWVARLTGFTITGCDFGVDCNLASPTIDHCVFTRIARCNDNNAAAIRYCNGVVRTCTIEGNEVYGFKYCNADVANCVIAGNEALPNAGGPGGAMHECGGTISHCTIVGNKDGGLYRFAFAASGIIHNSIIWGNDDFQLLQSSEQPTYSVVQGGSPGEGNLDLEPRFSRMGLRTGCLWNSGDYRLAPDSPAINAGDPAFMPQPGETDLDGNARVVQSRVDIGAYEYQFQDCGSDFDGDGIVNCLDVDVDNDGVLNGDDVCDETPPDVLVNDVGRPIADLDGNCLTNAADLNLFLEGFYGALACNVVPAVSTVALVAMGALLVGSGGYVIRRRIVR